MTGLNQRIEWADRLRRRFSRGLTVIDFDGFMLRLALAQPGEDGRPALVAQTAVDAGAAPGEALVQAVADHRRKLKDGGLKMPRRAVLVTAQAVQGLVQLPVPPAKPRKSAQMRALLQADAAVLAGLFAQSWSLEGVLQAQGVIDDEARAALAAQRLREREQERQGARAAWLPGQELAERMGLTSAAQVDAAQRLLAPLQTLSGRQALAWCALPGQDGGPPWNWLLTAMDFAQRDAWREYCTRAGLSLAAIYPRGGLAALAWPEGAAVGLIERQHELVHQFVRTARGIEVAQSDTLPGPDVAALASLLALPGGDAGGLGHPPVESVVACAGPGGPHFAALAQAALGQSLRHAGAVLGVADEAWLPAHAAAALATGLRPGAQVATLAARERVPVRRHPDFMRLAVPAVLALVLAATAVGMTLRRQAVEARFVQMSHQSQEQSRTQEAVSEAARLRNELDARRTEAAVLANRVAQLDEGMARRVQLIPALMQAMAQNIPPTVVLDAVEESKTQGSFLVRAWSIDPTAISTFTTVMQTPLRKLGYSVMTGGTSINEARGRNGEAGYGASFWIVSDPDALLGEAVPGTRAPAPRAAAPLNPAPPAEAGPSRRPGRRARRI